MTDLNDGGGGKTGDGRGRTMGGGGKTAGGGGRTDEKHHFSWLPFAARSFLDNGTVSSSESKEI